MKLIDRKKPLSWPYVLLTITAMITAALFFTGPSRALNDLAQAANTGGDQQWSEKVREPALISYAERVLAGLLEAHLRVGLSKNPSQALADYQYGNSRLQAQARHLARPYGLPFLICGDFLSDPSQPPTQTGGCWNYQGKFHWRSPVSVKVSLVNPDTQWQSQLFLKRTGLFTWQLEDIDLPVGRILQNSVNASDPGV